MLCVCVCEVESPRVATNQPACAPRKAPDAAGVVRKTFSYQTQRDCDSVDGGFLRFPPVNLFIASSIIMCWRREAASILSVALRQRNPLQSAHTEQQ